MTIPLTDTVETKLYYFVPPADGSKPYNTINIDPNTGLRERNFGQEEHVHLVENVRGKEHTVSLDSTGFAFFHAPSKHKAFDNDAEIEAEYYPESIDLIKKLTGATRVVLFDHSEQCFLIMVGAVVYDLSDLAVRRRRPGELETYKARQPVQGVHVDQSGRAAVARVHRHLPPEEASELLERRFQIINLWRPINHPAHDHPLALCDYRSIDVEKDLVPVTLRYPDRDGETFGVNYNPDHKWKYLRGMTPDEIVLIKW